MQGGFKSGVFVTILVCVLALVAIGATFIANASPYVDVSQALESKGDGLHLLGTIDKSTVHTDMAGRRITFQLVDAKGKTMTVEYTGEAISNIGEATKVVAVGSVKNGQFEAYKLNIKCPSKYDDGRGAAAKSA